LAAEASDACFSGAGAGALDFSEAELEFSCAETAGAAKVSARRQPKIKHNRRFMDAIELRRAEFRCQKVSLAAFAIVNRNEARWRRGL
jgi:hypothetical protein